MKLLTTGMKEMTIEAKEDEEIILELIIEGFRDGTITDVRCAKVGMIRQQVAMASAYREILNAKEDK